MVEAALSEPFETVAWKSFARFRPYKPSLGRNLALLSRRMVVDVMQLLDAVPEATVKLFQDGMICLSRHGIEHAATQIQHSEKSLSDEHHENSGWTATDLMTPSFERHPEVLGGVLGLVLQRFLVVSLHGSCKRHN